MAELTMSPSEAPATVNQAALSGVRFLVSRRIEELETAAADLERDSANIGATLESAAARVGDLEERWHTLLLKLPDVEPKSIDTMFRHLANARADLATAEERHADLDGRVRALRAEQEMLRAVYRSLDDLAAAGAGREEGASKLRSASRQVFQIIEEERMRIARDMHDGPAQSMANLVLQAEILERLIALDPQMVISELRDFK
ncbi:MAG: histidine kinase dimerization/phosphoacceptor domain-containing protein, partial [Candidatus Dormibacteraeota bacterium]|nr:histidine kinase dimerization/phosphoacceptor domain-containing protein [Candidatus Dormibacteraeota bacterium]